MPSLTPISGNPLSALLPTPAAARQDGWRWGIVKQISPLRIQLDGDTTAFSGTPDTLVPVALNDRVRVHIYNRRATVIGVAGGVPYPSSVDYAVEAGSAGVAGRLERVEQGLSVKQGAWFSVRSPVWVRREGGRVFLDGALQLLQNHSNEGWFRDVFSALPDWARPAGDVYAPIAFSDSTGVLVARSSGVIDVYDYRSNGSYTSAGNSVTLMANWPAI